MLVDLDAFDAVGLREDPGEPSLHVGNGVGLGDLPALDDEELGAAGGGLRRSAPSAASLRPSRSSLALLRRSGGLGVQSAMK